MASSSVPRSLPDSGTWFAPPGRASNEQIQDLADFCLHNPVARAIVESVDGYVLILNKQRQVLAANPETLKALNVHDTECLLGLRPGELFGCAFSSKTPNGCGTSENCSTCGAVISILASQESNEPSTNECLMSVMRDGKNESHEFKVRSTPIMLEENPLTIFVVHDISASKRRDALENVFIHDLNNLLTGLQGWSEILSRRPQDATSIAQRIVSLSSHLTQEVQNQRLLLQAERGELKVKLEPISVTKILEGMKSFFSGYPLDNVARLDIVDTDKNTVIISSEPLLTRVLANMVKNAMEAAPPMEQVRVWFEIRDGRPCFIVHNPGVIPVDIARQIFKRSFSTKSSLGRGLGTYSMKLFGEQYLGGLVDFSTSEKDGTSFFITLPADQFVSTHTGA
jgi:K+-sensing histidine kinase KdpD